MKKLTYEITWSGAERATLHYLRDNLADVIAEPHSGGGGRITLSWQANEELAHLIDWDLWAPGQILTDLHAKACWEGGEPITLAGSEQAENHWRTGGTL